MLTDYDPFDLEHDSADFTPMPGGSSRCLAYLLLRGKPT